MNFALDKKYEMATMLFKEFAENEIKPFAQDVDETGIFPEVNREKMAKYGFFGITVPKEYNGQGCDSLTYALCIEELAKVCGSSATLIAAHTALCVDPILTFGTEEQKKTYLPKLAEGKWIGALAANDVQETTAVPDGDEWVINGVKSFVENGKEANVLIVSAVTGTEEKNGRPRKVRSTFIVEKDTAGVIVGENEQMTGNHGVSFPKITFENCRVSKQNMLGTPGQGNVVVRSILDCMRFSIAAEALGLMEGAADKTGTYVKERKQFGMPIARFQNTQIRIAEMATKIEAAKMLVYKAAFAKDTQKTFSEEAAKAKWIASRFALEVTSKAVQLHGGYGYMREYDVERMMREAKMTEVYAGTSEEQSMTIAACVMK